MLLYYLAGLILIDLIGAIGESLSLFPGDSVLGVILYFPILVMIGLFSYSIYQGNEDPENRKYWIIGGILVFLIGSPACYLNLSLFL